MKRDFESSVTSSANIFFESALCEQARARESRVVLAGEPGSLGVVLCGVGDGGLSPPPRKQDIGDGAAGCSMGFTGTSLSVCPVLACPLIPL